MQRYLIQAFHNPSKLILVIAVVGFVMILLFLHANDPETNRLGGGVATLLFTPCMFLFIAVVCVGVVVGARYVSAAYDINNVAMDITIEREYEREIRELETTNVMAKLMD